MVKNLQIKVYLGPVTYHIEYSNDLGRLIQWEIEEPRSPANLALVMLHSKCINRQIAKVHHIVKGGFALKSRWSRSCLVHVVYPAQDQLQVEVWPSEAEDE